MKKLCLLLLPLSAALIGCSRIETDPTASEAQDLLLAEEMPYLTFDSIAAVRQAVNQGGESVETKSLVLPNGVSLFSALHESIIKNDPVLSYEAARIDAQSADDGLPYYTFSSSVYDRVGYDKLVPDKDFARLLNARGELCVRDTMYKVSPRGTYYFPVSKRDAFEHKYAEYEQLDGTEVAEKTYLIDKDIYRFDTFNEYSVDPSFEDAPVATKAKGTESTWNGHPRYTGDAGLLDGESYFDYLPNNRRLKGHIFHYDYVVFDERGAIAKCQKKAWIGWSSIKSKLVRITWNNVIVKSPDKLDPGIKEISHFTDGFKYDHDDREEAIYVIKGYVIPPDSYDSIVRGGQPALRSRILQDTKLDIGPYKLVFLFGHDYSLLIYAGSRFVEKQDLEEAAVQLSRANMQPAGWFVAGQFFFQCLDDNQNFGAVSVGTAF